MSQIYIPTWFAISVQVLMEQLPEHMEEQFACRGIQNWHNALVRCLGLRSVAPVKTQGFRSFRLNFELANAIENKLLPSQDWLQCVVQDVMHCEGPNADTACDPMVSRPMDALACRFQRKQKMACADLESHGVDLLRAYEQNPNDPCEGLMTTLMQRTSPHKWVWLGTNKRELMWRRLIADVYYTKDDPQAKIQREKAWKNAQNQGNQMLFMVMQKVFTGELPPSTIKYWTEGLQLSIRGSEDVNFFAAPDLSGGD